MAYISNIGRNTRDFRRMHGWTLKDLAQRSGVDVSTLSLLERGLAGHSSESVQKLCKAFGISEGTLFADSAIEVSRRDDFHVIPMLQASEIAAYVQSSKEERECHIERFIDVDRRIPLDSFAFNGGVQAMRPLFSDEDCIVIDRHIPPRPKDFVLALDGSSEVVFRQYKVTKSEPQGITAFELVPMESFYPVIDSASPNVHIIGTMVEHRTYRLP